MSEETVTITKKEYEDLLESAKELQCLHAGGVDNWDWYHESLQEGGFFDDETEEDIYGDD